ncbi:alpha/beta fold hydrolase [Nonomuraea sp. NPDC050556]|uniref:alpha/beta fold hydrolase n=1 Tax=Nonomuraea sp. NPDC050556 TaxID=3364369 RepID=UPI003793FF9C
MSELATDVLTSADGTAVEYLTVGQGPGVIVVPGALAVAADFTGFANLLAARYTVHVIQRRGRGGSGPQGERYGVERETEDVEAVRARTGARLIFGHSFGGLVALRAAIANPAYDAVAVYEPGVSVDGSIPTDWIRRSHRELIKGEGFEAFMSFARGINPDETGKLPRWILRIILRLAIPRHEMEQNIELMPQALNEHVEVGRYGDRLADYRAIAAPTLITRGKGATWQEVALRSLVATIPVTESATYAKLDHFAPEKKPAEIAETVLRFFAAHAKTDVRQSLPWR